MPIHLRHGRKDVLVEVEIGLWTRETVGDILQTAAVLHASKYSDAVLEVHSAYPVPEDIDYFFGRTSAALFQLDLIHHHPGEPRGLRPGVQERRRTALGPNLDYVP